jgi:hypothetical protein
MEVTYCSLSDVPQLLESLLLEKYEPHISPIRSIFNAFYKVLDQIFDELLRLRESLKNNENGVAAIDEAGGLLRAAFGERKFSFYEPEALMEFLNGIGMFDKFRLYIHSVSHIEVCAFML